MDIPLTEILLRPPERSYWKDKVKMSDGCESRGSHPIDSQGQGLQSPTKIPMRTRAPVWKPRKLDVDLLFTKFPSEVDASDIHVKVDGWIWRQTPTGRPTLFSILSLLTIIEDSKSIFNVNVRESINQHSAQPKTR